MRKEEAMKGLYVFGALLVAWAVTWGVLTYYIWIHSNETVWMNDGRKAKGIQTYQFLFGATNTVELGMRNDGVVVWRMKQ
jgi:hypothetical protein